MQTTTPVYQDGTLTMRTVQTREAFLMRLYPDKYKPAEALCEKHGTYQTVVDTSSGEKGLCPVCWKEQEETEKKRSKNRRRSKKSLIELTVFRRSIGMQDSKILN